ncbi:MAG: glycosyltransferase, partial [Pseudomonadota bacterium]
MLTDISIVIPTYNEKENIDLIFNAIRKSLNSISWEIIFVDDNSPDNTAAFVNAISKTNTNVRCIKRIGKRGLSSACIEGILASSSKYVAIMDADMQHDEKILPKMLNTISQEKFNLVIGTRYSEQGSTGDLPAYRVLISKIATWIGTIFLKSNVSDPMSGFFIIEKDFFNRIEKKL